MGDRSRSPHRQGKFWRVLVSDGQDRQPVRIYEHQMGSEKDVEDFLAAVKKAEGLDGAVLSQMRLFRNADNADSQQAEAFETSMSEIPSHRENVLIVTYRMKNVAAPEVDLAATIRQFADSQDKRLDILQRQFADSQDLASAAFQAMLTPDLAQSTKVRDPKFRENVAEYQGYNQNAPCAVLSQRFPGTFEYWREHGILIFPSVADHIYSHKNFGNFKTLGFHRDDVKNGMLLFKDVEERAGNGELSFLPVQVLPDEIILQVHVSEQIRDVYVQYRDPGHKKQFGDYPMVFAWESAYGVCPDEPHPIRFGDLHDFQFRMKRPHLRALFWKAKMAHDAFNDLPDPFQHVDVFRECESLMDKIRRMHRSTNAQSDHVSQGSEKPTLTSCDSSSSALNKLNCSVILEDI